MGEAPPHRSAPFALPIAPITLKFADGAYRFGLTLSDAETLEQDTGCGLGELCSYLASHSDAVTADPANVIGFDELRAVCFFVLRRALIWSEVKGRRSFPDDDQSSVLMLAATAGSPIKPPWAAAYLVVHRTIGEGDQQ